MIVSKKPQRKAFDFLQDRQSGFAPLITILIVVILIVAGGAGYYFYKTSQEQKETEWVEPEQVIDETADWKIYRNEKYGFEVKYPSYFRLGYITSLGDPELEKIDDLNKGLPSFKGVPEDDELYIHLMAFNSLLETSDEPWEMVFTKKDAQEERQKLEQSVIGDPWQFRSEKPYGKVIGISGRKAAQYLKFSPQWGGYNAYFITYNNDGDRIELSVYLKSLTKEEAEKETRNVIFGKIFSTFKFIEEDKTVQISVFVDMESFDLVNKTFEGWWTPKIGEKTKVKVITTDSTEFYRTSEPEWKKEYLTFSELYSKTARTWPLTVKGIFEKEGVIKANEVFIIAQ